MIARRNWVSAILLGLCAAFLGGCDQRDIEAALILADIKAGSGPSLFKAVTAKPKRARITYRRGSRTYEGDLYTPVSGAVGPALVLVPGAAPGGRDDPRLRTFAETLARARFTVLVPEIRGLRALRVRASDVRHITAAVRHLTTRGRRRVGVAAISYSVGAAVLAAIEPDVRERIAFVLGIGGYYDLTSVVAYFTTGYYRERPGAQWRYRLPSTYGKWVFAVSNAGFIADPRDRVNLWAMARRKLANEAADISDLVRELGPEGRAVYKLIANRDPETVPRLVRRLPPAAYAEFAALDLAGRDLSALRARLILVHGRDDSIIPYTESRRLARAAGPGRAKVYLLDGLFHVELGTLRLADSITLFSAVSALLRERDRLR